MQSFSELNAIVKVSILRITIRDTVYRFRFVGNDTVQTLHYGEAEVDFYMDLDAVSTTVHCAACFTEAK